MTLTLPNVLVDSPDDVKGTNAFVNGLDAELAHSKKAIIAGVNSTSSTFYTDLGDRVDNLYANGLTNRTLIQVGYSALWAPTAGSGNVFAAIFIGNNQLKNINANAVPSVNEAVSFMNIANPGREWIISDRSGLIAPAVTMTSSVGSGITTGMSISNLNGGGGICNIIVPNNIGIFSVGIRWKVSAGTVAIQERKLWVRALALTGL